MPVAEVGWNHVERRLTGDRFYWLVTTKANGRPHAVAIWIVWSHGAAWFTSSPRP